MEFVGSFKVKRDGKYLDDRCYMILIGLKYESNLI